MPDEATTGMAKDWDWIRSRLSGLSAVRLSRCLRLSWLSSWLSSCLFA